MEGLGYGGYGGFVELMYVIEFVYEYINIRLSY